MTTIRKVKKRKTADERFRELIDQYCVIDDLYKVMNSEREQLREKLRKIIRYGHRPHGVHLGNLYAINTYRVKRRVFSQSKARELMGPQMFKRAFVPQKFLQIDSMEQPQTQESENGPPVAVEAQSADFTHGEGLPD